MKCTLVLAVLVSCELMSVCGQRLCPACSRNAVTRMRILRTQLKVLEDQLTACCAATATNRGSGSSNQIEALIQSTTTAPSTSKGPTLPLPFSTCSVGYSRIDRHCYRFVKGNLTQAEAKKRCEDLDGSLISVFTEDDQKTAKRFIEQVSSKYNKTTFQVHTYGNEEEVPSIWFWGKGVTAKPVTFTKWAAGEPNNRQGEDEHCIVLDSKAYWYDVNCNTTLPAICQDSTMRM